MDQSPTSAASVPAQQRQVALAIGGLGFSAVITQLVLMREMLGVFSGNELILGVILGNWLLLTGLGAALGRWAERLKNPIRVLLTSLILIALLPPAQVFLLRTLRDVVFIRGEMIGVVETVLASFVLLLPYCLISGFLLTLACGFLAARSGARGLSWVYFADSVGSLAGGAIFTFVLIHLLDHIALLCIPSILCLLLVIWLGFSFGRKALAGLTGVLLAGLIGLMIFGDLDALSTAIQYPGQTVLRRGNSPYGRLVVTATCGQFNFLENGLSLISTSNPQQVEEAVHYAMIQRPAAQQVLLISGGVSGTAKEILKYGVKQVTYVEQDPLIVAAGQRYLPQNLDDPRLRVVSGDGRAFVRRTARRFDLIILDVPDPSTSQINRYYTREFLKDAKRRLMPDGVFALALGHYENHVSHELARMLASAGQTLRESFRNVLAIPGGRVFLLASDGPLYADIAGRIEAAKVPTLLVNRDYLEATLAEDRMNEVRQAMQGKAPVNTDFNPVLYYYHLLYWISQFKVSFGVLEGLLLVALAVYLVRLGAAEAAIFASGFAASALEIVLLLAMQILCGTLYQQMGLVVTVFMAGLAAGAFLAERGISATNDPGLLPAAETPLPLGEGRVRVPVTGVGAGNTFSGAPAGTRDTVQLSRRALLGLAFLIAVFAAFLAPVLALLGRYNFANATLIWSIAIGVLTFLLALLVGMEFPLAGRTTFSRGAKTASRLYTADFVGACLGAFLTSTLLIPLLGVTLTCLAVGAVNVLAVILLVVRKGLTP